MNLLNQPVSYDVFVIIDFYDRFLNIFEGDEIEDNVKNVIHTLINKLVDYEDPMTPIEELASIHAASEITIFISDLIERSTIQESDEFLETLPGYSEDLRDLIVLLAEEEEFIEGLTEFLGEEAISPAEVSSEEPESIDSFEDDIDIAKTDDFTQTETLPIDEDVYQIEPKPIETIDDSEYTNFHEAFKQILLESVDTPDEDTNSLLIAIVEQLDKKKQIVEQLLPSEFNNLIQLIDEAYQNSGASLLYNKSLIQNNINDIDEELIQELRVNHYDILKTFKEDNTEAAEAIPVFSKQKIAKPQISVDPEVKEKLRNYFIHEVKDFSKDIHDKLDNVETHIMAPVIFEKIKTNFMQLKDVSLIHGYDAIELIANELEKLMDECIKEHLVFTNQSEQIFKNLINQFEDLAKVSDQDTQKLVDYVVEQVNLFNKSLAIVEVTNEEIYTLSSQTISTILDEVIKLKIQKADSLNAILASLSSDYLLQKKNTKSYLCEQLNSADQTIVDNNEDQIKMLLANDVEMEDINDFLIELGIKPDVKTQETTKQAIPEPAKDQELSFHEFKAGHYRAILIKKIEHLITLFKESDSDDIITFTSQIQEEVSSIGYDNIEELFNFYTMNPSIVDDSETKSKLLFELERLKEDSQNYAFSLESFEQNEEEDVDGDGWISSVADVLEEKEDDISLDTSDIDLQPVLQDLDPDIQSIFADEASSYLEELTKQITALESKSDDFDAMSLAEKAAHTLKGASMMLEIKTIGEIAYKIEKSFEQLREFKTAITPAKIDSIYKLIELVNNLLAGKIDTSSIEVTEPEEVKEETETVPEAEEGKSEEDVEMLQIFQEESSENIEQIEKALNLLKDEPDSPNVIKHIEAESLSLKSAAKMLGFKKIGMLAESIENGSESILKDELIVTDDILTALNHVLHNIKELSLGNDVSAENFDKSMNIITAAMASEGLTKEFSLDYGAEDEAKVEDKADEDSITSAEISSDDSDVDEFTLIFLEESIDIIDKLTKNNEELSSDYSNTDIINNSIQLFYTLKNSASSLNFENVKELCDQSEHTLNLILDQKIEMNDTVYNLIKSSVLELISISKQLEENGTDKTDLFDTLMGEFEAIQSPELELAAEETQSSEAESIEQRTELKTKRDSLQSVMDSEQKEEDSDRQVVTKNANELKAKIDELNDSIEEISESKTKTDPENTESVISKDAYIINTNDEFYAIDASLVDTVEKYSIDDEIEDEDSIVLYLNDQKAKVITISSIIGLDKENRSDDYFGLHIKSGDSLFILQTNTKAVQSKLDLFKLKESTNSDMFNMRSETVDGKTILFFKNEYLFKKAGLEYKETKSSSKKVKINKIKKKTIKNRKPKALIADDSSSIRKFISVVISNFGYEATLATDGADALTKINNDKFDVIITDIEMPNVSGFELITNLREDSYYKSIPIIVLTGRSATKDKDKALDIGANSYILKPFKEIELKQKLADFIEIK